MLFCIKKHLEKQLLPDIDKMLTRKDWIYIRDSAPSHRSNLVQGYLKERLGKRFVKSGEWPPSSPDCKPLDYHFWDKVKVKKCTKIDSTNRLKMKTSSKEESEKCGKTWLVMFLRLGRL